MKKPIEASGSGIATKGNTAWKPAKFSVSGFKDSKSAPFTVSSVLFH